MPVAPPASAIGPVAGVLEAAQHDQADQVAVVEARRRGVAAVVEGDRALGEPGGQRGPVGGVVDQAALVQVVEEVGAGIRRTSSPRGRPPVQPDAAGCPRTVRPVRENGRRPCAGPSAPSAALLALAGVARRVHVHARGPSTRPTRRRSSRPRSTPPTARSCTRSTPRRTARSSRSSEIPAHVREAVIAIEDERFYRHNGVDPRAILRAARTNVEAGEHRAGRLDDHPAVREAGDPARTTPPPSSASSRRRPPPSSSSAATPRTGSSSCTSTPSTSGTAPTGSRRPPTSTSGSRPPSSALEEGALLAGLIQRPERHRSLRRTPRPRVERRAPRARADGAPTT